MVVRGEAIVIVLDVGKSMQNDKSCPTALEEAKDCISMVIQRKIFSESKDEIALILFGCGDTSDSTDENSYSEYENVSVIQNLGPATWKLYELVNDIKGTDISTDFIRDLALLKAVNLLQNTVDAKKIDSRRILFLSNFDGYFYSDQISMICDELKANKIEINIIGPVVFPEDIKSEMYLDECQDDTKVKSHVSDILREVNGESYSFSDVLPALINYQMKKVQPYPQNANLEIGTLTLPISVFIKVSERKPNTWQTACVHDIREKPKRSTTFCMNDEMQTRVSFDNLIPAFKYGTTLVPYSQVDKNNMDYQPGEKGMKLIGFTKAIRVQRYLYIGDKSRYVFAQKNNISAGEALAAFIEALYDNDMVAIVRYVPTVRSAPSIGFLAPRFKPSYECLIFIVLPFMEDMRHFVFTPFDSDSKNIPTEEQLDVIDEFITAMDLTEPIDSEDEGEEILEPKKTVNPYMQRLYQCLQHRAFHPEKSLPLMESHVQAAINPCPKILKRAETSLMKLKDLFPIKYVPKKVFETRSNLFSNKKLDEFITNEPINENVSETKFVTEAKLVDAMTDKITQVGSINPVRDIQYLINNQVLPFNEICEQINDVVSKLLQDGDHLRFNYPKILTICKEYRGSSLKEADCEKYNIFMLSLQKQLLEINEELWDKIRIEKIELISKEELPSSSVSSEQAEMFLSKLSVPEKIEDSVKTVVPCDDDDDEDDLMDQL